VPDAGAESGTVKGVTIFDACKLEAEGCEGLFDGRGAAFDAEAGGCTFEVGTALDTCKLEAEGCGGVFDGRGATFDADAEGCIFKLGTAFDAGKLEAEGCVGGETLAGGREACDAAGVTTLDAAADRFGVIFFARFWRPSQPSGKNSWATGYASLTT
jgi:hypothetical protein